MMTWKEKVHKGNQGRSDFANAFSITFVFANACYEIMHQRERRLSCRIMAAKASSRRDNEGNFSHHVCCCLFLMRFATWRFGNFNGDTFCTSYSTSEVHSCLRGKHRSSCEVIKNHKLLFPVEVLRFCQKNIQMMSNRIVFYHLKLTLKLLLVLRLA